jgi:protein-S-isoprenylcysteine O-methyltransferase Ste14
VSWYHLCLFAWTALGIVWLAGAFLSRRDVYREPFRSRIVHLVPLLLACALGFTPVLDRALPWLELRVVPDWLGPVGLAVTAIGAAFTLWGRVTLGRLWSGTITLKEGHRLMKTGPFAVTRHPIYTGALTAALGTALASGEVRVVVALVVASAAFVRKLLIEERVLAEKFGQEHADYRARVARLVPFVW